MSRSSHAAGGPGNRSVTLRIDTAEHEDGNSYKTVALFEYCVAGKTYQSERYQFSPLFTDPIAAALDGSSKYKRGADAVCYVNPRDPTDAVLVRDPTVQTVCGFFSIIVIGASAWFFFGGKSRRPRRQQKTHHKSRRH